LNELGVRRGTMLWSCSDNAPEGDKESPQAPGTAGVWRGRQRSLIEGGVRVPGILERLARYPKPFVLQAAASTSGHFPAAAAALGAELPVTDGLDGIHLLPLLDRRAARPRARFRDHGRSPRVAGTRVHRRPLQAASAIRRTYSSIWTAIRVKRIRSRMKRNACACVACSATGHSCDRSHEAHAPATPAGLARAGREFPAPSEANHGKPGLRM
jgi:hypothetical protein